MQCGATSHWVDGRQKSQAAVVSWQMVHDCTLWKSSGSSYPAVEECLLKARYRHHFAIGRETRLQRSEIDACLQHALTCSMQPTADPQICLSTTNLYPNN
ncbi:hypothetical protein EVAR_64375_1 [Eumeta japonica]|uniref:Uncharacterized protein n=1 Tax=Eumeta variegata TaxID=151549 RepID=A0A4C1ZR19_EUMVA|nr:hypothetical protein EVAR_64375_1 [Eumeta japonica]